MHYLVISVSFTVLLILTLLPCLTNNIPETIILSPTFNPLVISTEEALR